MKETKNSTSLFFSHDGSGNPRRDCNLVFDNETEKSKSRKRKSFAPKNNFKRTIQHSLKKKSLKISFLHSVFYLCISNKKDNEQEQ